MTDNTVMHQARLHKIIFLGPLLVFFFTAYVAFVSHSFKDIALFMAFFSLIWVGMVAINYSFSSLTIKKKHVILVSGLIIRQTLDIPVNKIESIDIRQNLLGSILHYGTLVITGTGGTRQFVHYINRPLTCRRYIEQVLHH